EERLGLNKPAALQYLIWLRNLVRGDLGISTTGGSVFALIMQRASNTLVLGVLSILFTWLIAIPAGVYAAVHRAKGIDKSFGRLSAIGMSMPTFLLALILLMFAVHSRVLPIGGLTSPDFYDRDVFGKILDLSAHLVIPTTVLTFVGLAAIQRQMRGSLLDVL